MSNLHLPGGRADQKPPPPGCYRCACGAAVRHGNKNHDGKPEHAAALTAKGFRERGLSPIGKVWAEQLEGLGVRVESGLSGTTLDKDRGVVTTTGFWVRSAIAELVNDTTIPPDDRRVLVRLVAWMARRPDGSPERERAMEVTAAFFGARQVGAGPTQASRLLRDGARPLLGADAVAVRP